MMAMIHGPVSTRHDPRARLADVHESVERLLDRLRDRTGPAGPPAWKRGRRRLLRLLDVERRVLQVVAQRHGLGPVPALLDPRRARHQVELGSLLQTADDRARRQAPWPRLTNELEDFLAWTFITVERAAGWS